jgi:beta-mannosidase
VYVPSAPCGGDLPFRTDRGVANYYGVGAYRRPLADARRADVRFAAECLAFSNVPDQEAVEQLLPDAPAAAVVHHPRWKAGVPRDVGAGWDFEDVRDHYLSLLFGVDPAELRGFDHERYLELSRGVTGEVMAEVFGEWRRGASRCAGGLVLWLRDVVPGAGWGIVDHRGHPKAAYHHLRRALAPVAVWLTDEGLGGMVAHVANDRSEPLRCRLRVALYRDLEQPVDGAEQELELAPHSIDQRNVEALLGRFVDVSWAYRFGPPSHDLVVASLERDGDHGPELLSQALRFPAGRPAGAQRAEQLGIAAGIRRLDGTTARVLVRSRRLAYGVRLHVPGFVAEDDAFAVEPGRERAVLLRCREPGADLAGAAISALNLDGRLRIATGDPA